MFEMHTVVDYGIKAGFVEQSSTKVLGFGCDVPVERLLLVADLLPCTALPSVTVAEVRAVVAVAEAGCAA